MARVDALRDQLRSVGVEFKDAWWTLGVHDVVNLFEAPDDETMAAASLTIAEQGNVRLTTMRAFTEEEMRECSARSADSVFLFEEAPRDEVPPVDARELVACPPRAASASSRRRVRLGPPHPRRSAVPTAPGEAERQPKE